MIQKLIVAGDLPHARFGHSLTLVDKQTAILYGGAIGDTGNFTLTGDTFIFQLRTNIWKKIQCVGTVPGVRAAHGSCAVEGQLVIFGGALGGGDLADSDIYCLQIIRKEKGHWSIKKTIGSSPGKRYGHCLSFVRPHLVVIGGNTGSQSVNDVWVIDLLAKMPSWSNLDISGKKPKPRVYHSSSICLNGNAKGMIVIFGGRSGQQNKSIPLNDTWGLRMHRSGNWDWVQAPYKPNITLPVNRYQHSTHFMGTLMMVVGGRAAQHQQDTSIQIYDTQTSQWFRMPFDSNSDTTKRFRHSSFILGNNLYLHGGFQYSEPTIPTQSIVKIDLANAFHKNPSLIKGIVYQREINQVRAVTADNKQDERIIPDSSISMIRKNQIEQQSILRNVPQSSSHKPIRLCNEVVVTKYNPHDQFNKVMKKVPLDELPQQRRKLIDFIDPTQIQSKSNSRRYGQVLNLLLNHKPYNSISKNPLSNIPKDILHSILQDVSILIQKQPSLLIIRPPVKIFGDLYGQFADLLGFFQNYGSPSDDLPNGDIDSFDYLFLGNYVGFGTKCLQTIFLLFVLKLKYPDQVHLLRGNMEDRKINIMEGFGQQCTFKFNQDSMNSQSFFNKINKIFQKLPLAALLDQKILCLHKGIGNTMTNLNQIDKVIRPVQISLQPKNVNQSIVYQILHSEIKLTQTKGGFTPQRLQKFIHDNNLNYIIRGTDSVLQGIQQFNKQMISLCSCTDVKGQRNNNACILIIKKSCEMVPKIIKPSKNDKEPKWIETKKSSKIKK